MTRNKLIYHLNFLRCMHWTCPNPWSLFLSAQDRLIMLIYFPPIFLTQNILWHMPSKTNLYMNNRQSILHNVSVGTRLYVWVRSQMKNRGKEVQMSCRKKIDLCKRWDTFFNTIILFYSLFSFFWNSNISNFFQLSGSQARRIWVLRQADMIILRTSDLAKTWVPQK